MERRLIYSKAYNYLYTRVGEIRNADRMNQHEIRVWYFVGQYAAKPRQRQSESLVWAMSTYFRALL